MLQPPEWEIEVAYYVDQRGIDPDKAETFVILRWMWLGDFRPLIAALDGGQELDQAVRNLLAQMLERDATLPYVLKLERRKGRRGALKKPEKFARDTVAALMYEGKQPRGNSDAAFQEIAEMLRLSPSTVRSAVSAWRRSKQTTNKS